MRCHLTTVCLRTRFSNSEFGVRSLFERSACCQDSDGTDTGDSGAMTGAMTGAIAAKLKTIAVANLPILQFSRSAFLERPVFATRLRLFCVNRDLLG